MIYPIFTSFGKGNNQALNICSELARLQPPKNEALVFDFATYGENNPFSNLLLINSIRRFRGTHRNAQLKCRPKDTDGYLSHIGFYKACGIDIGKEPGEARASSNYVPITEINLRGIDFYNNIEEISRKLSATLQFDEGLQKLLTYTFIETIRNVFEHAETEKVLVSAQKWPTYNLVEIAISDSGCGITSSLGKHFVTDPINLLHLACSPGISAKSNYYYLDENNPWINSGYGLYILKELAVAYQGSFVLCSGEHAIRFYSDGISVQEQIFKTNYLGTTIGIRFVTNTGIDFEEVRKQIVASGQEYSMHIKGAINKASQSSGGRYYFD